jgi:NLR family CARD domain-containing protein 3
LIQFNSPISIIIIETIIVERSNFFLFVIGSLSMGGKIENIELNKNRDHHFLLDLAKLIKEDNSHKKFNIKKININHCQMDEAEFQALFKILLSCDHLNNIILSGNDIDIEHAIKIFNSLHDANLHSIIFSDNWIGENDAAAFVNSLVKHNSLALLDLGLDGLGDTGVNLLVKSLKNNPSLTHLNLSCNGFFLQGLEAITTFVNEHQSISTLDLSYNGINRKKINCIVNIISKENHLINLNLSSNQFGDEGASYIARALRSNKNLLSLNISDNELKADGLSEIIESVLEHKKLINLDLSHNKYDRSFVQMVRNKIKKNSRKIDLII